MLIKAAPLAKTAAALQSGELDLKIYLDQLFEHIDTVEPQIQALVPEAERKSRLYREATVLQLRYPDPTDRPPLYGIPVGVKDIYRVDGFPTQAGSEVPADALQGPEAASVTILKEAGALILGKTVTTEFAYFEPGPTRNPYDPAHTPGGSSSGSAAAVAAGISPLSLGTQTIGSIVRPAAFCGVVGFKPSYARVKTDGLLFVSPSLDHVGMFTQDIEGMILAASILCQNWQSVSFKGASPVFGVPDGAYLKQASEEGLIAFEKHISRLEQAGYQVKRVTALDDIEEIATSHIRLMAAEMAREHNELFEQHSASYRPRTVALIRQGKAITEDEITVARTRQAALRTELQMLMTDSGIDLWVAPSSLGPAPEGISSTGNPAMNLPWTQAGLPSINIPAGKARNKLPLGLQIIGKFMADEQLLTWAVPVYQLLRG